MRVRFVKPWSWQLTDQRVDPCFFVGTGTEGVVENPRNGDDGYAGQWVKLTGTGWVPHAGYEPTSRPVVLLVPDDVIERIV